MNLALSGKHQATEKEWDTIWEQCEYSTYFHSREWAEIWQKYTRENMTADAVIVEFSDGATALLPFSTQTMLKGLVNKYILSPAGTFGGWLSTDKLSNTHGRLLNDFISNKCKYLTWRLNPYNSLETKLNIKDLRKDETHVLELEPGFETIHKSWTKGHTSAARKARQSGVEVREAKSLEDWVAYYEIYQDSLKRWGEAASSCYEWQLFQNMCELSSTNIKLWIASFEGKMIAGALCFYAKKHVVYWHGSALSEYFNLRPVNLLMYEIIRESCENGYQWFDFNPSGGNEGVIAFKKSFGAKALNSPVVCYTPVILNNSLMAIEKTKIAIQKIKKSLSL